MTQDRRTFLKTTALAGAAALSWGLRLQPVDPGWIRLALAAPLMSSRRAERELGWKPQHNAVSALRELVAGIAEHAGPPLTLAACGLVTLAGSIGYARMLPVIRRDIRPLYREMGILPTDTADRPGP